MGKFNISQSFLGGGWARSLPPAYVPGATKSLEMKLPIATIYHGDVNKDLY